MVVMNRALMVLGVETRPQGSSRAQATRLKRHYANESFVHSVRRASENVTIKRVHLKRKSQISHPEHHLITLVN